jgi:hypothetical protein
MTNETKTDVRPTLAGGPQLRAALARVEMAVVDGLRHGFFEMSISCSTTAGAKRDLLIRSGKSHKFTIPESELPD